MSDGARRSTVVTQEVRVTRTGAGAVIRAYQMSSAPAAVIPAQAGIESSR